MVFVGGFFEETPEGFGGVGADEDAGHFAARDLVVGEAGVSFDPAEELEGFTEPEVDAVGVSVGRRAQKEEAVVELAVFVVEVALAEGGAVAEAVLAANGAVGLEGEPGDGAEDGRDGVGGP